MLARKYRRWGFKQKVCQQQYVWNLPWTNISREILFSLLIGKAEMENLLMWVSSGKINQTKPNQTKPSGNGESEFADVSLVREDKRGQTILSTSHSSQLDILKPNSGLSRQYCTHHTKPLLVFVQKRKHIGEWKLRRSNKFSVYMKEIYKRAHHSSWGLKVIMFDPISGYSIPHCTIW